MPGTETQTNEEPESLSSRSMIQAVRRNTDRLVPNYTIHQHGKCSEENTKRGPSWVWRSQGRHLSQVKKKRKKKSQPKRRGKKFQQKEEECTKAKGVKTTISWRLEGREKEKERKGILKAVWKQGAPRPAVGRLVRMRKMSAHFLIISRNHMGL